MLAGTSWCLTTHLWGVCCCTLLWELLSRKELQRGCRQHKATHRHFGISPVYPASPLPRETREEHREVLSSLDADHEEMLPSPQSGPCASSDGDVLLSQSGADNLAFC